MTERRGREKYKVDREKNLWIKRLKNDLIAENQRLKERLEYLEMEIRIPKKIEMP